MSKRKRIAIILTIVLSLVIAIISSFFGIKYFQNKSKISNVLDTYSSENVQERITNENAKNETVDIDNLMLKIDGEDVIGVIEIDRINFKGLVYESTSLNTLAKGVGHFENTPYFYRKCSTSSTQYK